MSWSYSGDPSSSPMDEVRFLTGDTRSEEPILSNEEILYHIRMAYGSRPPATGNFLAAAYAADLMAARSAGEVTSESVGDISVSYGERSKNFTDLASQLRRRATFASVGVYVGGMSVSDKRGNANDPDLPALAFQIDGMNNRNSDL